MAFKLTFLPFERPLTQAYIVCLRKGRESSSQAAPTSQLHHKKREEDLGYDNQGFTVKGKTAHLDSNDGVW